MDTLQTKQGIAAGTGIGGGRGNVPRSVGHVGVLVLDQHAWSLLILGDPGPYPVLNTPQPSLPTGCPKSQ